MSTESVLPPGVELVPATRAEEPVLANLLELYAHDFSEFVDLAIGDDGRFHYPQLPLYWEDEGRVPFLVRVDAKLAGFVLVSKGSRITGDPSVWDMAEFFILRRYRRRQIGAAIARETWRRLPGPWEVRVRESNAAALAFWGKTLNGFTRSEVEGESMDVGGARRRIWSFVSPGDCGRGAAPPA